MTRQHFTWGVFSSSWRLGVHVSHILVLMACVSCLVATFCVSFANWEVFGYCVLGGGVLGGGQCE